MFFVSSWLFWNSLICFFFFFVESIVTKDPSIVNQNLQILLVISIYSTVILFIKTVFAVLNHIRFYLCCCNTSDFEKNYNRNMEHGGTRDIRPNHTMLELVPRWSIIRDFNIYHPLNHIVVVTLFLTSALIAFMSSPFYPYNKYHEEPDCNCW